MTITAGAQFDHYEIIAPLGAGGMGEVYRALDTRLDREVAIKVLPAEFAKDADRLRRFEQEARATSALNHPNILTVYDIGTHDGAPFIVAELLEGEELRAQLQHGAIAPRQALDYAQQIVAGLAAAHAKGIVHRDLKPENLFVTTDGRVKILDFGLAKLKPQKLAGGVDSEAPTLKPLTNPGVVMGTVGYMSPEQVHGQEADHRADVFAFGLILYEMLAGRRAFEGGSAAAVMSAILRDEPLELSEVNEKIPPQLERLVRRCLEKKPERRFQSASDLGFALEGLSITSGSRLETAAALPAVTASLPTTRLFGNARLWVAVAAVAVLGLLAALPFAVKYFRQPSPESQVTRFSINPPTGTITTANTAPLLALSPDGRRLVISAVDAAGKRHLWLRALDSFTTQPLPGTDGGGFPFWSPDGRYIAFSADRKLRKLDVGSGVIETLCSVGGGNTSGDWNRNGVLLFGNGNGAGLSRVNAVGGKPEIVTEPNAAQGETAHNFPSFLPDGKHYLFQVFGGENSGIYAGSLDSKDRKLVLRLSSGEANSTKAVWAPAGYILYALNRTTLLAQAFDPDRLELKGEPFRIAGNVIVSQAGVGRFTASANGVLAFIQGGGFDTVQLTWRDRSGKRLGVTGSAAPWRGFSLSPDQRFMALRRDEPGTQSSLWLLDLVQGTTNRFITEGESGIPIWSPDGKQLAFFSARNRPPNLFLKSLAGNTQEERLLESPFECYPSAWSPDGKFLVFWIEDPQTRSDLWLLPTSGERKPQPLLKTKAREMEGRVSPDGNWLAYDSTESGSLEIYVTQFPQPARSWRISRSGGGNPFWRGDGKELYFVSGNELMTVSVNDGKEFQAGTPQPLFEIEGTNYAPSKNGQRFLVTVVTEKAPAPPINVVLNWTAEVKR